jgi:CheY-like chemotaxis protein
MAGDHTRTGPTESEWTIPGMGCRFRMYVVAANGIDSSPEVDYKEENQTKEPAEIGPRGGKDPKAARRPVEDQRRSHPLQGEVVNGSPKLLVFGSEPSESASLWAKLRENAELQTVPATDFERGFELLREGDVAGVVWTGAGLEKTGSELLLFQMGGVLSQFPEGLAVLDADLRILWSNRRFNELTAGGVGSLAGQDFYSAFGSPEILGPDPSPFYTALGNRTTATTQLKIGENTYYQIQATPLFQKSGGELGDENPTALIVLVREVSQDILLQQKLNAIHQAGAELGDISPTDLADMTVHDRVELLKSKIIHFTKDLLRFETVEIRLVEKGTKRLKPLLAVGMKPEAANRELFALPEGNGVTGFVAATGKSYLCADTSQDPLYLPGAPEACSSLTVPLILHDEILGTFNVESTRIGAFNENDLQFLELFSREVAVALNTLDLLAVEKLATTAHSIEWILGEVAQPLDEILNEATWVLEGYMGHDPKLAERLKQILEHTRGVKNLIQQAGEKLNPEGPPSPLDSRCERPKLRRKRILVADNDEQIRRSAHEILGRAGCIVETAHDGTEAILMARMHEYDVVLVDIRLPEMSGYQCFCQLRSIDSELPVILTTGFGYDAGHSIVKARQAGLKSVLFKPFRVEQLLTELEKNIVENRRASRA